MEKALLIVKNLEKIIDRASSIAFKSGYIACSNEQPYVSHTPPHRNIVAYTKEDFIKEAIVELEEAMKPKTCLDCKHYSQSTFYGDLKVVKYCHENRLGIGDINFQIFCCNKFEQKDKA